MNRSLLGKKVNKEVIDELKNNTQALSSFLQNENDGTIVYALGKSKQGFYKNGIFKML